MLGKIVCKNKTKAYPLTLPGIKSWIMADAYTTSSNVSTITDLASGLTLSKYGSGSIQIADNVKNGKKAILFPSNAGLDYPTAAKSYTQNQAGFTVFVVAQNSSTFNVNKQLFEASLGTNTNTRFGLRIASNNQTGLIARRTDTDASQVYYHSPYSDGRSMDGNDFLILGASVDYQNSDLYLSFNGRNATTTSYLTDGLTSNTASQYMSIGYQFQTTPSYSNCKIMEVIVCQGKQTLLEMAPTMDYLNSRYAIY